MVVDQFIPLFTSFDRSQAVQDFSHQQYVYIYAWFYEKLGGLFVDRPAKESVNWK